MTISRFMERHYRHFNARETLATAKGYKGFVENGGKMVVSLAGAMSTAELGISLAEMIRQDKVHAISCTAANLEEDLFNLFAHNEYKVIQDWRSLSAEDEVRLYKQGFNRVTDTSIPETVMTHMQARLTKYWIEQGKKVMDGTVKSHAALCSGTEQLQALAEWYRQESATSPIGFFQIGGGIAGDFSICAVPMLIQDLDEDVPMWSYFAQISDAVTSYGGYSGAVPNEKITWKKLSKDTPKFMIQSDATIVAPLIFAYVLGL